MVDECELITISLEASGIRSCVSNAGKASLGGHSGVRSDDRMSSMRDDQLVGQFCEAALSVFLFGTLEAYERHRSRMNRSPYSGDGGVDYRYAGHPVDVKGSKRRSRAKPILEHNLIVPPSEFSGSTIYVSALVSFDADNVSGYASLPVILVGWEYGERLYSGEQWGEGKLIKENWLLRPMEELLGIGEVSAAGCMEGG